MVRIKEIKSWTIPFFGNNWRLYEPKLAIRPI